MKSRKVRKAGIAKTIMAKRKANITVESDSDADVDETIYKNEKDHIDDELSTDDELIRHDAEVSEEEEVLPITDDENEDQSDGSEFNEEDNLPNREAWGKKKSQYYSADFVDEDRGKTYREKDAERAKAELEEALAIQRSVSKYTNVCLTEELQLQMTEETPKPEKEDEADLDALTKDQKLKLLKKKFPEVLIYKKEILEKMNELKNRMIPLVEYAKKKKILSSDWVNYIYQRYEVLVYYCLNMSYYFVLKSRGNVPQNHPIFQRVNEFKEHLVRLDTITETVNEDLDHILKELQQNDIVDLDKKEPEESSLSAQEEELDIQTTEPVSRKKKEKKSKKVSFETPHEKEVAALYEDMRQQTMEIDSESEGERDENLAMVSKEGSTSTGEKRTITYEIAKNKGLVAKRNKEKRNPRVHHRMKFKRAQIRRKGQVRNVIKEIKRYDGEPTGISKNVVKSVKFK